MKITCQNDYLEYLKSPHWIKLKKKYIYNNPDAKCFITNKTSNLLLHHISYENLGFERINKDIVVIDYDYHKLCHFFTCFGVTLWKYPLKRFILTKILYYNKFNYCIQQQQFWRSLLYLFILLFS